ncbi:MAG: ABC transporter ATP-binding protein [Candidatus Lokiarchaeota archaeon]|nr:ABC transporter ATP-binding protein [Candidatus Lokiarchaeota archaeon]
MVKIDLKNVSKSYGKFIALKNISLQVKDKEYFIILGPTGGGKTTLLKIISGLVKPDDGEVLFDDIDVTRMTPGERNIGFMFENYALFPHMNLVDNISYSGRVNARNPEMTKKLVEQVLMMTLLTGRNEALPEELSGGMKQRVALCRSLLNLEQTKLLILDEPLKALDAGLRMNLRRELLLMAKSKQLELTVVHVTNEEEEAMMVADRIAVINQGELVQVGTPHDIYYYPKDLFVANFMSEINYFDGICIREESPKWDIYKMSGQKDNFYTQIHEESSPILIDLNTGDQFAAYIKNDVSNEYNHGDKILLVVRANHMKIRLGNRLNQKKNSFFGKIIRRKFMGVFYRFEVLIGINNQEKTVVVTIPATSEVHNKFKENLEVTIYFPKELGIVFKHPGNKVVNEVIKLE